MAVDYLSRFELTRNKEKAFEISILGARLIKKEKECFELLDNITGLNDKAIMSAIKIVGFDVCFRAGPDQYKPVEEINPNQETIENVRVMVERSVNFFKKYGPVISDGFTFEGGGYTKTIDSGDGDFLTKDTLWDFKVSSNPPTNKHTLQLLVYYIMGKHSNKKEFETITNIGIFNPRLNVVYTYDVTLVQEKTIKDIEDNVIVYSDKTKKEKRSVPISDLLKTYVKRNETESKKDSFKRIQRQKRFRQNLARRGKW